MWEQNTRKLMIDLERLRKELYDQLKKRASLEAELFELYMQCVNMKQEIKQLNTSLYEARATRMDDTQKELEDELKFQKESIVNLSMQLKKSIEANGELVSVVQEHEGSIEKQKTELNKLTVAKSQFEEIQGEQFQDQENLEKRRLLKKSKLLGQKVQKLETECVQLAKGNSNLQHELDDLPRKSEYESHCTNLKNKSAYLDHELQTFKDKGCSLDDEPCKVHAKAKEQENDIENSEISFSAAATNICSGRHRSINKEGEAGDVLNSLIQRKNFLEAGPRESQKHFSDMLKEIKDLDAKSSSMLEGINLKVKAINARLDGFLPGSEHLKEKVALEESHCSSRNPRKLKLYETKLDLLHVESDVKKLEDEISCLKVLLQKVEVFRDEVFMLKSALCAAQSEQQRLETSFQAIRGDREELKVKGIRVFRKYLECRSLSKLEACRLSKAVIEGNGFTARGDPSAREALLPKVGELKSEFARLKTMNIESQRRIRCLEEEKADCLKEYQALEEELRILSELRWRTKWSLKRKISLIILKWKPQEDKNGNLLIKISTMEIDQSQQFPDGQGKPDIDEKSRTDTNPQLERDNSTVRSSTALVNEKENEQKKKVTSEEKELRDIRESCYDISLKYAEVEADREQLPRKLKNNEKKWF
nr:myosin-10-like [Ziziphus jujuba var. spinosa]